MTITERELELAKDAIGNILGTHQAAYTNIKCLRLLYKEKEPTFRALIANHAQAVPLQVGNAVSHTYQAVRNGNEFLSIKAALDYAEQLPEVVEALEIIEPMVAEVERLEAKILEERETAALAQHALNEIETAARERAEALLAKDPEVAKARKALEQAQPALVPVYVDPPAPYRGKTKIVDGVSVPVEA